jgi:hypothetical protein
VLVVRQSGSAMLMAPPITRQAPNPTKPTAHQLKRKAAHGPGVNAAGIVQARDLLVLVGVVFQRAVEHLGRHVVL